MHKTMNNTPAGQASVAQDAAMLALIEHIVRKHRAAAQDHERAGRASQAEREYAMLRRIERYLAGHRGPKRQEP